MRTEHLSLDVVPWRSWVTLREQFQWHGKDRTLFGVGFWGKEVQEQDRELRYKLVIGRNMVLSPVSSVT